MTSFYEELRKSDTISDEKENAQSRAKIDKWIFRLFLFLIGFMPLVVMANVEEVISPLVSNVDVLSSGVKGDLFTHYKALIVLAITIITGAMLLIKVFFMGGTIRKTFLNYVLGLFVVAIVVSTIASPNISIALNGQYNRSDGAISWLCYVALMFIAMNIEYPKNTIKYIMYTMMPFVYINLYIITMNFYGKDLLQNSYMQRLVSIMLPEGANISEGSTLVGTLNQWNYMSGMFAMMTLMYLAWAITSKKWIENIVGAITASVSISIMFMSISTSGFLTVVVVGFVLLISMFRVENKLKPIITIILFLLLTVPVFINLSETNEKVWENSFGFFIKENPHHPGYVTSMMNKNKVYANNNILILPSLPDRSTSAGSGRLYIWDKTLDLINNRLILGHGIDTLVYMFPHYNIDARSGLMDENIITDKPHNQLIGILYGFGILGFACTLILLIMIGILSLKTIIAKKWDELILSIIVLAYFSQTMFNDSLPSISSISFIIMGILMAAIFNRKEAQFLNGRNNTITTNN